MSHKRERPAWKAATLKKIKHMSMALRQKGMSPEELGTLYKQHCGVSEFRNLDYCTDVVLNRLIKGLEDQGYG